MNSDLIQREADALLSRLGPDQDPAARIRRAYLLLFQREPSQAEVQRGLQFLNKAEALFQSAAAEPPPSTDATGALRQIRGRDERARRRRRPMQIRKLRPCRLCQRPNDSVAQYAQALLSAGEFTT
jgi:hypothetical protein